MPGGPCRQRLQMASFGSVAAHRHRGHICDLHPRRRRGPRTVRANVSGSQIRGRFVISVTTAPRRPGRAVFGATSDRDDIRGSTRGSQIRGGRFTSVTSASALLSRKFGVVHICDLRVGAPLPKVRRTWLGHGFSAPRGEERPRYFCRGSKRWIEKALRTYVAAPRRKGTASCNAYVPWCTTKLVRLHDPPTWLVA